MTLARGLRHCTSLATPCSSRDPARDHTVATVKKALITPLRDRWTVTVADGPDLDVKGNIVNHEYTIEEPGPVHGGPEGCEP